MTICLELARYSAASRTRLIGLATAAGQIGAHFETFIPSTHDLVTKQHYPNGDTCRLSFESLYRWVAGRMLESDCETPCYPATGENAMGPSAIVKA